MLRVIPLSRERFTVLLNASLGFCQFFPRLVKTFGRHSTLVMVLWSCVFGPQHGKERGYIHHRCVNRRLQLNFHSQKPLKCYTRNCGYANCFVIMLIPCTTVIGLRFLSRCFYFRIYHNTTDCLTKNGTFDALSLLANARVDVLFGPYCSTGLSFAWLFSNLPLRSSQNHTIFKLTLQPKNYFGQGIFQQRLESRRLWCRCLQSVILM